MMMAARPIGSLSALLRAMLIAAALLLLTGARDPLLVPEVSQHEVVVRQGFTGADLLLYGAILPPDGARPTGEARYDIVIVLKGPSEAIVLREKQKRFGIWFNADSTGFRSAPSFYAVASSRPLSEIVDERTAAIYELGLNSLQLSPIGAIDIEEQQRFGAGLVGRRLASGLYRQDENGVTISGGVLYQAKIPLPSSVITGTYTAETFAIADGRVLASATAEVEVRKRGLERAIELFSVQQSFLYGLLTILIAIAMGWLAGRLFALR